MEDTERRTKRSRFDQTEPEPKRASRFDRRSRSPHNRRAEAGRDRSPLSKDGASEEPKKAPVDAAAAAGAQTLCCRVRSHRARGWLIDCLLAAAAARINAQLQARKGIQHVDVPPIKSASPPPTKSTAPSNSGSNPPPALDGEMYVADGDYIQDIEVNDLRNRYLLTKGSTQKMVNILV